MWESPGVCGKGALIKFKADHWDFGAAATKDQKLTTHPKRKRSSPPMKVEAPSST